MSHVLKAPSRSFFIFALILGFMGIFLPLEGFAAAKKPSVNKPTITKSAPRTLDQKGIHKIYTDGDFEAVLAAIDSFTVENKSYSLSDSVFIAKHLAVVYTANPATREKGKHYMFRLLSLLPSAKIVDMFVSDEIDHIFGKVKEEFLIKQQAMGMDVPNQPEPLQPKPIPEEKPKKRSNATVYWVAGGLSVVAVSGTAFYLMQPKKMKVKPSTFRIENRHDSFVIKFVANLPFPK